MIEGGCQARVAVAARHDFGVWQYLETDLLERAAIFLCGATGKKNSSAINLLWQLRENCAQTFGRGKPEIRWRHFALIDDAKFRTGHFGYYEHPGGFRTATFHPEDALAGLHVFILYGSRTACCEFSL